MPVKIHLVLASQLSRIRRQLPGDFTWCYFGANARLRMRARNSLGMERQLEIGRALTDVAYRIRDEFQVWMMQLGDFQTDKIGWWGSVTATRSPLLSDLFRFICYFELTQAWLQAAASSAPNCIVVEDIWLWQSLQDNFQAHSAVQMHGSGCLRRWIDHGRSAFRAGAARMYFFLRVLILALETRLRIRRQPDTDISMQLLFTWIEDRSFESDGVLHDPYSGRLGSILERDGSKLVWHTNLLFSRRLLQKLHGFADRVIVAPAYITFTNFFRVIFSRYHLQLSPRLARFRGWDATILFQREMLETRARTGYLQAHLFHRVSLAIATRYGNSVKTIVFPFENQEWEKPFLHAWHSLAPRTRLIAHKNYPMRPLLLGEFLAPGEAARRPMPNVFMVCGEHSRQLMLAGGHASTSVWVGGGLRFEYLWCKRSAEFISSPSRRNLEAKVLLAMPYSAEYGRLFYQDLRSQLSEPLLLPGKGRVRFLIKCHPHTPFRRLFSAFPEPLPDWIEICDQTVEHMLPVTDLLLYAPATSVALEAARSGVPVLRYVGDNLDLDIFPPAESPFPYCTMRNLRSEILRELARSSVQFEQDFLDTLLTPVRESVWLQLLGNPPLRMSNGG